jgi:sugar-specific transcriptional regulator TrmB
MSKYFTVNMDERGLGDLLEQFGLSEKEIDTYLAILERGEAKASEIAAEADVSKRYVYSISEELEKRGFVEVNDHVIPTTFEAKPPDEVLADLSKSLDTLRPELNDLFTATVDGIEQFEVVKTQVTVEKRLAQLIERAEKEIALSLPIGMLEQVEPELAAAVDRDVFVILVLTGNDGENSDVIDIPEEVASVVRVWREHVPMILAVDSTYGLVAPVDMLARTTSDMRAISIAQPQLVPVLSGSFLGNYWPMAEEVYHVDAQELPATFRTFRETVMQADLHLRADDWLTASIEARPVFEDGEYRTIEGRVSGVRQDIVKPASNYFPVENSLVLEIDDEEVTIGGPGAFVEDYEAREVVLEKE